MLSSVSSNKNKNKKQNKNKNAQSNNNDKKPFAGGEKEFSQTQLPCPLEM